MQKLIITIIAVTCLCCCTFETDGLPASPTVWRAWVDCGEPRPMPANTPVELREGWQCMAHTEDGRAVVTCWHGAVEHELENSCPTGADHERIAVAGCVVELACCSSIASR